MIEQQGEVIELRDGEAVVQGQRPSACGGCAVRSGCGASALGGLAGQRSGQVVAVAPATLRVGDSVTLGLEEGVLQRAALVGYLLPLAALFGGALTGQALGAEGELPTIIGAALGFAAGLCGVRRLGQRAAADPRYRAVVLGTTTPADDTLQR